MSVCPSGNGNSIVVLRAFIVRPSVDQYTGSPSPVARRHPGPITAAPRPLGPTSHNARRSRENGELTAARATKTAAAAAEITPQ